MIDTKINIDSMTRRRMEKVIEDFVKATGGTAEDGVKKMAKSAARRLASTVHPYGLGSEKKDKGQSKLVAFHKNLQLQVGTAWVGTNLGAYPATNNMAEAHRNARRGSTGRVNGRQFRKEKGKPWLNLISRQELNAHIKTVQAKALRAKAAWVRASDQLGKPKMSGLHPLVKRHVANAWGSSSVSGKGMQTTIHLSNNVPYVRKIQYTQDISLSIAEGYKNALKSMQTATSKAIEKANRATQ